MVGIETSGQGVLLTFVSVKSFSSRMVSAGQGWQPDQDKKLLYGYERSPCRNRNCVGGCRFKAKQTSSVT